MCSLTRPAKTLKQMPSTHNKSSADNHVFSSFVNIRDATATDFQSMCGPKSMKTFRYFEPAPGQDYQQQHEQVVFIHFSTIPGFGELVPVSYFTDMMSAGEVVEVVSFGYIYQ